MEITSVSSFLDYYEKIRQRTLRVVKCIPPEQIEWTYQNGKFTIGDLLRHICAIERYLYAENVRQRPTLYSGHGRELADGYEGIMKFMIETHQESMRLFSELKDEDLQKKCVNPDGTSITIWKWLRAMVEHEIHHRGQVYLYLAIMNVATPPLFGLTSEEVRARSLR